MPLHPDLRLHPVLEKPWTYEIVALLLDGRGEVPFLELFLRRGSDTRGLRFFKPQDITLDPGYSLGSRPSGIAIVDVSGDGLEEIGVRVSDAVAGQDCALTFSASSVEAI